MVVRAIIGIVGLALIAVGLFYGYSPGIHMIHAGNIASLFSVVQTNLRGIATAIAFFVVGGLLVVIGLKRR